MKTDDEQDSVNFDTAVGDPAAYYADPQAIVADQTLARSQKLRFLTEWAQDLADRQTADGEGMAPEDNRTADMAAVRLPQVVAALAQVEAETEVEEVPTTRTFWSRLRQITG